MSEKQKALLALNRVLETSKAAFTFLSDSAQNADPSLDAPNLSLLHKDFLSLLSLIYGSTTRLSLVLKPSSPSYTASLEPLKELSDRIASLPHCVRLIQAHHGKTLATEAHTITRDVIEALKCLIQTFIATNSECHSKSKEAAAEYLVRTAALHDIIENARGPSGFSGNNLIAVQKIWKHNQDSLDDSLEEIREALENAEKPEGGAEGGDEFDDGWEELGIPSIKPSAAELETIKKIHTISRLSTLLHQRILKDVLSAFVSLHPLSGETSKMLDELATASSNFLSSSDDLISTMYSPRGTEQIAFELKDFQRQLSVLQSKVEPLISEGPIEEQFTNLQLSSATKSSDRNAKLRKWCTVCVNQIGKNILELEHELKRLDTPLA